MAGLDFDRERVEKLGETLPILFYALLFIAFLCAVLGSPGSGLLILILAGCAHVARVGIEGLLKIESSLSPPMDGKGRTRSQRQRPARNPARRVRV